MSNTESSLKDIKDMLIGIQITIVGVAAGVLAILFANGGVGIVSFLFVIIGLVWTVAAPRQRAD